MSEQLLLSTFEEKKKKNKPYIHFLFYMVFVGHITRGLKLDRPILK